LNETEKNISDVKFVFLRFELVSRNVLFSIINSADNLLLFKKFKFQIFILDFFVTSWYCGIQSSTRRNRISKQISNPCKKERVV